MLKNILKKKNDKKLPSFDETFKYLRLSLKYLGIPANGSPKKILFGAYVATVVLVLIGECMHIVDQMKKIVNITELAYMVPCIGIALLSIIKIFYIYFQRNKIYWLIVETKKLYKVIEEDKNKIAIVLDDILMVKALTKYYTIINLSLTIAYDVNVPAKILHDYYINNKTTMLLKYPVKTPFAIDNWFNWSIVFFHAVVSGFVVILFLTTADLLFCNLICHVCVNFAILSEELKHFNVENENNLKEIVVRHQTLIRLSQVIEEIFSGPNFFNIIIQSMMMCALGFHISVSKVSSIPKILVFLMSTLFQIFLMSLFGEKLIYESGRVGHSAFLSKWYKMSYKSKKTISFICARALRPQVLTAYNFSIISYGSFSKIISTAWSYFTILRTVYNPENNEE